MAVERTLSIVKPDGVAKNLIGEVYRRFEQAGLKIIGAKMLKLRTDQAEGFYAVHRERPFFGSLAAFMSSVIADLSDIFLSPAAEKQKRRLRALSVQTRGAVLRDELSTTWQAASGCAGACSGA